MNEKVKMKTMSLLIIIILILSISSCDQVNDNAVNLNVDFTWEGMDSCEWGNPQITFSGIPESTKSIIIHMFDHAYNYDHGEVEMLYSGNDTIEKDRFKDIQGPCPPRSPGKYEITIKALDENDVVIGIGSKTRLFPEN